MKYKIDMPWERVEEGRKRIYAAYHLEEPDRLPFGWTVVEDNDDNAEGPEVNKVSYREKWENPDLELKGIIENINKKFREFPDVDDFPLILLECPQETLPTMFGVQYKLEEDGFLFDWANNPVIRDISKDRPKLKKADPFKDGIVPQTLNRMKYFIDNTCSDGGHRVPVSYMDYQSPLGIAAKLMNGTQLMMELYEHPDEMRELMDFFADTIINVIEAQKKYAGSRDLVVSPCGFGAPPEHQGMIWDDFPSLIKQELYLSICKNADEKILNKYGGGHMHACGPTLHNCLRTMMSISGTYSVDAGGLYIGEDSRTTADILEVKKITKGKCFVSCPLPTDIENITVDILKRLNDKGGFYLYGRGTYERGMRILDMIKKASKQKKSKETERHE